NARHRNRRKHASVDAELLEAVLQRQRVHHRRQHAHVVGGRPVEPLRCGGHAAEDIATADHDTQFMALALGRGDLAGKPGNRIGIDPELALTHQSLARDLEQDAVETRSGHAVVESPSCNNAAPLYGAAAALPTALLAASELWPGRHP